MIFDVLEKKLTDAGLVVPGKSLFRQFMGGEVTWGVMLRTPLTGIPIDAEIESRHAVDLQAITRHTDPVAGMALANEVSKVLLIESPEVFELPEGRVHVSMCYPKTLPIQFPRLEGNGLEFSQHFYTVFVTKPTWR